MLIINTGISAKERNQILRSRDISFYYVHKPAFPVHLSLVMNSSAYCAQSNVTERKRVQERNKNRSILLP